MKPINKMKTEEVNREIAEWMEWFAITGNQANTGTLHPTPDFCGSWDAAGPLLDKLVDAELVMQIWGDLQSHSRVRLQRLSGKDVEGSGLGYQEAIARCWLAWRRMQNEKTA